MQSNELKKSILELLDKDPEFRYTVAGYIGYREILERIVALEERVVKLDERVVALEERVVKLDERIADNQARNEERFARIEEELRDLRQETNALREETNNLREVTNRLVEVTNRLVEETTALRNDTNSLITATNRMQRDIKDIKSYMDRLSLSFEDEAREVIAYMLREKGITMSKVDRLILPDVEIDIYGTDTDTCIIGEASVRVGVNMLEEITDKLEELCKKYQEYIMKKRVIIAIYTMYATPDAVASAKSKGIWLVTPTKELTELMIRTKKAGGTDE